MNPSEEQVRGLNLVLNEARLLAVDVASDLSGASLRLQILSLPPDAPEERSVELVVAIRPIAHLGVSLVGEGGLMADLLPDGLSSLVASFGCLPIYGWEFFDPQDSDLPQAGELSLDLRGEGRGEHRLHVFQEELGRSLHLWFQFDELDLASASGMSLALDDLVADAKAWWEGLASGDRRLAGSEIKRLGG